MKKKIKGRKPYRKFFKRFKRFIPRKRIFRNHYRYNQRWPTHKKGNFLNLILFGLAGYLFYLIFKKNNNA